MSYYTKEKKKANLELWEQVSRTNPAHTKPVSFGRGFTAIDAHSQIMCATEAFGPIGKGWGYSAEYKVCIEEKIIIAYVTVWHTEPRQSFGPICSIASLYNKKGQLDDDAGKKAMTDALTKGLSHLGFNADVFLGKFDDNKYVQKITEDIKQETVKETTLPDNIKTIIKELNKATNKDAYEKMIKKYLNDLNAMTDAEKIKYRGEVLEKRKELGII